MLFLISKVVTGFSSHPHHDHDDHDDHGPKIDCKCTETNYQAAMNQGYREPWGVDTYGSTCKQPWDLFESGCSPGGAFDVPDWCYNPWCYVEGTECDQLDDYTPTGFFAAEQAEGTVPADMGYSYSICGAKDEFDETTVDGHQYDRRK
mmetsp:Transcript_21815/g.44587  ORF Transcript_21815/g.44587 Transcript_21815/m.44587 type:complete len:148 (+) Transcript_21815:13-456(+)|eukprot:CAMPEP_0119070700 /NCGR_PEP_ID=MMETSP1178-20130426/42891_1 /TAXON_ID=33656 /ORGANISM="unid sp, Strain CCMP2000" /LENGTH=147 /DNA_ID=CAMNT_0007052557 /DNA_START=13 /DNA_END=456 /DNA_ORIENTATION=-